MSLPDSSWIDISINYLLNKSYKYSILRTIDVHHCFIDKNYCVLNLL